MREEEGTATTKRLVAEALMDGDDPSSLICFYHTLEPDEDGYVNRYDLKGTMPVRCSFDELPERRFYAGYGGASGEPVICFSDRYVYVRGTYDGSEWVEAVPRHPEYVTGDIPEIGGG